MPTLERMKARQKVLADFGDFALRSDDLDEVLHEACRLVAEGLRADLAKILEISGDGDEALVKAGVGWKPGVVGRKTLTMSERSSETHALNVNHPVASQNIRDEDRFEFADFLLDHDVTALVNAPIFLPGGKPYGLLQVDSREPREFGTEDMEFLRTYTTVLGPVVDRLHKAHSLEQALENNQRLLRELQHRVKNHIGIITSIVRMRANHVRSDEAREELNGIGRRIETLRLVHEQLYEAGASETLRMRPFLTRLFENLRSLHGAKAGAGAINLECDIADVELAPEIAIPLGLISNEFATNSLKYAFGDEGGTIAVSLQQAGDNALRLCLCDDGKGLPPDPQPHKSGSGTGMRLIEGLSHQLGTEPVWPASEVGTKLCLDLNQRRE